MQPHRTSATASLIALSTVFLSRQPRDRDLVPAGAAAQTEGLLTRTSPRTLRLIQRHYAARKRYIEDAARAFLSDGGRQLLVLGAGLDTLTLRIARELPEVRCVEVDHPATSAVKQDAIGAALPDNLTLVPLELGREAREDGHGLDPSVPTFVVLEGVTMYLTEPAVLDILRGCARLAPGSQLVWTFMHPDGRGRLRFHQAGSAVTAWLARQREPFTWGLPLDAVPAFLRPTGLELEEIVTTSQLRTRYLDPRGIEGALAEGEAPCLVRTTG